MPKQNKNQLNNPISKLTHSSEHQNEQVALKEVSGVASADVELLQPLMAVLWSQTLYSSQSDYSCSL